MADTKGGTAFPVVFTIAKGSNDLTGAIAEVEQQHVMTGMSLRDYFAAKALPEAIRHHLDVRATQISPGNFDFDLVAVTAYKQADAMLKARG